MNKTTEYALVFIGGLAAGVACSSGYFKNKYRAEKEEEIASVRHAFYRSVGVEVEKSSVNDADTKHVEAKQPAAEPEAVDYRVFYKKENELEEQMAIKEHPTEVDKPFLISEEEYSETELGFDKMTCTYYISDRIVVDDLSREVLEPSVIGEENLEYLMKTEAKFVYIRNEQISCDLEISKDSSSAIETGDVVWRN